MDCKVLLVLALVCLVLICLIQADSTAQEATMKAENVEKMDAPQTQMPIKRVLQLSPIAAEFVRRLSEIGKARRLARMNILNANNQTTWDSDDAVPMSIQNALNKVSQAADAAAIQAAKDFRAAQEAQRRGQQMSSSGDSSSEDSSSGIGPE